MLPRGPARKITIYVGEDVRVHGEPLYLSVLNYLFAQGAAGVTATKGVAGFGADHRLHTARILELSGHLPIKIEFVETAAKTAELIPRLIELMGDGQHGLIVAADVEVVSGTRAPSEQHIDDR